MGKGVRKVGIKSWREREDMFQQKHITMLNEYLGDEILKRRSTSNLKGLRYRVKKLLEFIEKKGIELNEVRINETQEYQGWLLKKKKNGRRRYTKGSIINLMKAAMSFYNFLKRKQIVYMNPFAEMRRVKYEKKLPRNILKEKEMHILLSYLGNFTKQKDNKGLRKYYKMHVICELMYATALRASEASALKKEDIDFNRSIVEVKNGKGGIERIAFLNEYAREILRFYIEELRELVLTGSSNKQLLFGMKGNGLITELNKILKKACMETGLKRITSHGFRHAVGYHLLRAGCDIRYIQELLGHRRIRNTEIYTKVDKEDLKQVLDTYHPRTIRKVNNHEETHS
jgi:integrase/recombinase XerD